MAALSVKQNKDIDEIAVRDVQDVILNAKGYLLPYLDVPVSDDRFTAYQRVGATGILKGVGKNVEWSNQTWLRADTVLLSSELTGLYEFYPSVKSNLDMQVAKGVTTQNFMKLVSEIAQEEGKKMDTDFGKVWKDCGLNTWNPNAEIIRGDAAVIIDKVLDPFHAKQINIKGKVIQ